MKKYIICMMLFFSVALFAQQKVDTARTYTIPEVTVIDVYRVNDIQGAVPTQVFTQCQLQMLNAMQLSDAVKHFAGVTVKDYGGIGGLKTVSIRSLGAEHTGISYDGIALTDCQTGQIDIGRFSLENVSQLSLSVGQGNTIFQPARLFASAGILNIVSMTPSFKDKERIHGVLSLKTGSWGLINPFLRIERKLAEHWVATVNGEWMSADGSYPFTLHYDNDAGGQTSSEKRHNTQVRNLRFESELFGNFSKREQLRLKVYYYRSSRGLPGATTYYYNHSSQHLWDKNFFVQGHYQKEFNNQWVFQSAAKWNWSYEHYLDPDYLNSEGKTENSYFQQEYYLSSSILYRACSHLSFSFSSDESVNSLNADLSDFAYPSRFTWLSVFAAKYMADKLTASASFLSTLTDEHVRFGSAAGNRRRFSPFADVLFRPFSSEDFHIRFFYKDIFHLPTFNDLYYGTIGNRSLNPEITKQVNIGLTYGRKDVGWISYLSASIDAYYNKVKDKIIAVPTKNLFVWSMTNLGKVDIRGVDMNGSLSFVPYRAWKIDISGNYTYQRALDKTDKEGKTYNQQIAYTPRVSGSGQLSVESPWFIVSYSLLYLGKRYVLGQNIAANRLGGYTDSSISIRRTWQLMGYNLMLSGEVLNILNKNYEIVKNFPMAGRSFRINFGIRL